MQRLSNMERPEITEPQSSKIGGFENFLIFFSYLLVIITFPFSLCCCLRQVMQFEKAVIFRMGRVRRIGARGPGLIFILPCVDEVFHIDLRTVTFTIPTQEILTKDSVTARVDGVVYIRVVEPMSAVISVNNYMYTTKTLASTTLRKVLGTQTLTDILSNRDALAGSMKEILDNATHPWGVKVERVEIKDVALPADLQRALAAEAEAAREANAKIVIADGELKASKALSEAAAVMSTKGVALQLRYLQTLATISAEKNSTICFPLPISMAPFH